MNDNKGLRFWKWVALILVLCNIGLILTIWVKPNSPFGNKPETPRDFVVRSLKFSDDQVKKYDTLITTHRGTMDRLRKESNDYRHRLFDNLKNGPANSTAADSLSQLIGNNQKQIELVTYNHFAQVRMLCTDDQKVTFDQIIGNVTKMMNGNNHRPGDRQGPPPNRREGHEGPPNDRQGPPEND